MSVGKKDAILVCLRKFLNIPRKFFWWLTKKANRLIKIKKCNVCDASFGMFASYRGGRKNLNQFLLNLDIIGSDLDNFGCLYCGCHDRVRHLFLFFERLLFWEKFPNSSILHFAPEKHLQDKIEKLKPDKYVKADLFPTDAGIEKIDATAIPYEECSFDFIIANHILEHIPEFEKALSEFYRVLKPGGHAILQTPCSAMLQKNFEDPGINTEQLKRFFYGQEDHVRIFSYSWFLKSIERAGFKLDLKNHSEVFTRNEAKFFGVNPKEDLILVSKLI